MKNIWNTKRVKHNVKDLYNAQTKTDVSYKARIYPSFTNHVYEAHQLSFWLLYPSEPVRLCLTPGGNVAQQRGNLEKDFPRLCLTVEYFHMRNCNCIRNTKRQTRRAHRKCRTIYIVLFMKTNSEKQSAGRTQYVHEKVNDVMCACVKPYISGKWDFFLSFFSVFDVSGW